MDWEHELSLNNNGRHQEASVKVVLCCSFIDSAVADSYNVCVFRLECPFDTAVELAAFSMQGKHSMNWGFSPTLFLVIWITSVTAAIVFLSYV